MAQLMFHLLYYKKKKFISQYVIGLLLIFSNKNEMKSSKDSKIQLQHKIP